MILQFEPKGTMKRPVCKLSTNGLMVQFMQSALGESPKSNNFNETVVTSISLGGVKRLMTELDSSPKAWTADC